MLGRLRRKSRQGNVIREGSKAYKADLKEIQEDSEDCLNVEETRISRARLYGLLFRVWGLLCIRV